MTYLLDISALMAVLWQTHVHNERVTRWQAPMDLALCPLSELGFLRISTQPGFGLSVGEARKVLRDWKQARPSQFVPCDLEASEMDAPPSGRLTTDFYLASLAGKHGMQLATLDQGIRHEAVFLIPA